MEFKDVGDAVKKYVSARDRLNVWRKKMEEEELKRKTYLEQIEMWLLRKAEETGVDAFKTKWGTAYRSIEKHYRILDWSALIEYVKKNDAFQIFQKRVTKSAIMEIQAETEKIPDGLDYFEEFKIGVRRPSSGGKKDE